MCLFSGSYAPAKPGNEKGWNLRNENLLQFTGWQPRSSQDHKGLREQAVLENGGYGRWSRDFSKKEKIMFFSMMFNSIERNFIILSKFEQELIMSTQKNKQLQKIKQYTNYRGQKKVYKKGSVKIIVYHKAQLRIIFAQS